MNAEVKRRAPDPATRRPRSKKAFEIAEAKGADAARYPWIRAFRGAKVPMNAKAVGFVLASYGNADGTSNHPGLARLARDFDVDEKTVRRHLDTLERSGWVRRTHDGRAGISRKEADDYQLTIPQPSTLSTPDGGGFQEEPPGWLDGEPEPDDDQWTNLSTDQAGDQWTIYDRPVDKIVQTPRTTPTKEEHGVASRCGVASATPNGSRSDPHGIDADAPTAAAAAVSIPKQRKPEPGKPQRELSSRVSPEDRARCNHYIALLPHLDDDEIDDALTNLWVARDRLWVSAYREMRKKFGGAPLPKPYRPGDHGYIDPDTPEQARFMYEKALRFMSRDGGWHKSLTDPLEALPAFEPSSAAPSWAA